MKRFNYLIGFILFYLSACSDSPFVLSRYINPLDAGFSSRKIDYTHKLSGDYFANVHYENPNTNYSAYYNLKVVVEDDQLTTIYFPKGGQLDTDHFESPEMEEKGEFRFKDDKGREFQVYLICEFDEYCAVTSDKSFLEKEYETKEYRNLKQ